MTITVKTRNIILLCFGVVVAIFILGWAIGIKNGKESSRGYIASQDSLIHNYVVKIGDLSYSVSEKIQEVTTLKEVLNRGLLTQEELRKLRIKDAQEITVLKSRIDVLLRDTLVSPNIIYVDTCGSEPRRAILLPFEYGKKNQWIDFNVVFSEDMHVAMDFKMPLNMKFVSSYDKKANRYEIIAIADNPYLKTDNMASYKLNAQRVKKWGIGLQAGYSMTLTKTPTLAPTIGIGISRNIIRF